jgi:hypothetical protein
MRIFFTLIIAVLFAGCSLFENEQSIPSSMIGEWEWTSTSGGWGPNIAADTADYSMTLFIYSQNEAEWYQNKSLLQTYYIKEGRKNWEEGAFLMRSKSKSACGFRLRVSPENGELIISSADCTDQPYHYFRKVKD